jgi:DNA-binding NarL/FixJ family response regulator
MAKARHTILCIEGHDGTAAFVADGLTARGFVVVVARSGNEGLLALRNSLPDLVLYDLGNAIAEGPEPTDSLNQMEPGLGKTPLLFFVRPADRASQISNQASDSCEQLANPIDLDRLAAMIRSRLGFVASTHLLPARATLTERQIQALALVALGKTSAQIARELGLSKRTADYHINNARKQMRAKTRAEAAIKALADGLIKSKADS